MSDVKRWFPLVYMQEVSTDVALPHLYLFRKSYIITHVGHENG